MTSVQLMYWLACLLVLVSCSLVSGNQNAEKPPPVAVIGAGYSGLSAALELRFQGYDVVMYEKANHVGGRGYKWSASGYTFDAGPSWYWMPHIFEDMFKKFGRKS